MTISRKWLLALFQAESMRDSFLHESRVESILGLPVYAARIAYTSIISSSG